jgi:3'-phosphoadenosine 5'-phosphosulfate (PAPS) 3'-phosphatase
MGNIKNSCVFKIISVVLIVAFVAPDISGAYPTGPETNTQNLAAWLANDQDPMRNTQNDIASKLKPGAIGNGQPLIDLVRGDLPERIALDSTTEDSLREAIDLAIELHLRNRGNISPIYEDRADQTLANLYALKNELRSRVHIFNSLIQGPEDYLLGFNREGVVGLSIGLVNTLHSISPELLAQYIYHECIPEHYGRGPLTKETDREEHRGNYKELQTAIFGKEAVSQLGRIFREKIMRDVSIGKRASELGYPLPKWSIFQAEQLVLWNMHHSAVINENVSRDSEIIQLTEKMVVSSLGAAYKLRHFMDDKKEMMIEEKADKSLVTEVDVIINEFLRDEFAPLGFPFVGEESEDEIDLDAIKNGTYLTVDPIDGTSNFVKMFNGELDKPALDNVTLISLVKEGVPVVGICLNHYTGELDVAINDGDVRFESHIELGMLAGLGHPGVEGRERVGRLNSREALIMGSKADDPINQKYSSQMPTAQIGGLGFRIISLSNKALQRGLVYHKKQKAGLWDLAAPNVFASLNGVTILDGDGNPLDFTQGPYFPGHGAMATKGDFSLLEEKLTIEKLLEKSDKIQAIAFDIGNTLTVKTLKDPKAGTPEDEVIESLAKLIRAGKNVIIVSRKSYQEIRPWIEEKLAPMLSASDRVNFKAYCDRITKLFTMTEEGLLSEENRISFPDSVDKKAVFEAIRSKVGNLQKALLSDTSISEDVRKIIRDNPLEVKFGDEYIQVCSAVNIDLKGDKTGRRARAIIRDFVETVLLEAGLMTDDLVVDVGAKGAFARSVQASRPSAIRHLQKRLNLTPDQIIYVADQFAGKSVADLAVSETGVHCLNVGADKNETAANVINCAIQGPSGSTSFINDFIRSITEKRKKNETASRGIEIVEAMYDIPRERITMINNGAAGDVDKALSSLAEEMASLLPKIIELSARKEGVEKGAITTEVLYHYGKIFAGLDAELMRKFMVFFANYAGNDAYSMLNMISISLAGGIIAQQGEVDMSDPEQMDKFLEDVRMSEEFHRMVATETIISGRKGLTKGEMEVLARVAELAVKRDIHAFDPILLHMQAKNFSKTLAGILQKNLDKTYVIGVDSDLGPGQHSQLMEIFAALDQIEKMFPNLKLVRRSGSSSRRDLASEINTLIGEDNVDPQNIFMVVKQDNLETKRFEDLQGRAWISAIDDSGAAVGAEGAYMPIFEAATISMLASINADAEAIKKVYDSIALDPETRKEVTLETVENMIRHRVLYLLPRIEKIPLDDLRMLYERVRTVYLAA